MAYSLNQDIRLYYEIFGESGAPAVLLLNGAGRQSIDFADEFVVGLLNRGFRAIRFDQRDTGLSSNFSESTASVVVVADDIQAGRPASLAYGVEDLAADAISIMDAAGIDKAHLFGRSLGSLTAQVLALNHPERVLSATLAMAFSRPIGGGMTQEWLARLDSEDFPDSETFVARQVESARALGNPAYFNETSVRESATLAYQRGVHRGAVARHFMVGLAAPDLRTRA